MIKLVPSGICVEDSVLDGRVSRGRRSRQVSFRACRAIATARARSSPSACAKASRSRVFSVSGCLIRSVGASSRRKKEGAQTRCWSGTGGTASASISTGRVIAADSINRATAAFERVNPSGGPLYKSRGYVENLVHQIAAPHRSAGGSRHWQNLLARRLPSRGCSGVGIPDRQGVWIATDPHGARFTLSRCGRGGRRR
jgi:hypothetical protein